MIKVTAKYLIFDLPPDFSDAVLDLSEGATVSDMLDASLELFKTRNATMDEKELRSAIVVRGGKWVEPDDRVSDGDVFSILRPMDGG